MFKRSSLSVVLSGLLLAVPEISLGSPLTTSFEQYSTLGLPELVTYPDGRMVRYTYDTTGQVLTSTECGLQCGTVNDLTTTYTWENGQLKTMTQADGLVTTYGYDTRGFLNSVVQQEGDLSLSSTTDSNTIGWINSVTDVNGNVTTILERDAMGRPLRVEENSHSTEESVIREMQYDKMGNITRVVYNPGGEPGETWRTEMVWGLTGTRGGYQLLESETLWQKNGGLATESLRMTYEYDVLGRITKETLHSENPTSGIVESYSTSYRWEDNIAIGYGGCGIDGCSMLTKTGVNGQLSYIFLDKRGKPIIISSERGNANAYEYDGFGRLSAITEGRWNTNRYIPGNSPFPEHNIGQLNRTEYQYDEVGRLLETRQYQDRNNNGELDGSEVLSFEQRRRYNEYGLVDMIRNGDTVTGDRQVFNYDQKHRLTHTWYLTGGDDATINGYQAVNETTYDGLGRVIAQKSAENLTTRFGYEGTRISWQDGPRTDVTDITRYTYTPAGRVASVQDGLNYTSQFSYDRLGRLTSVQRPGNDAITYSYDGLGRVVNETVGGISSQTMYWPDGRLHQRTDLAGKQTQYLYNSQMELVHVDREPLGSVPSRDDATYLYGLSGEIWKATDYQADIRGITTQYGYDSAGRLVYSNRQGTGQAFVHYEGNSFRISSQMDGQTEPVVRTYRTDTAGRTIEMGFAEANTMNLSWDVLGRQTLSYPASTQVSSSFNYNDSSQLIDWSTANTGSNPWLLQHSLAYNGEFVDVINESGDKPVFGDRSLTLDANNRMTEIVQNAVTRQFDYNPDGSIADFPGIGVLAYDNRGWLDETDYPLDGMGNMRSYEGDNSTFLTSYDNADRLLESNDGNVKTSYHYDAMGDLILRCSLPNGGSVECTQFLNETFSTGLAKIVASKDSTGQGSNYLYGTQGQLLAETDLTDTIGSNARYFVTDHLNSVIGSFSATGQWLGERSYSAYGAIEQDTIANMPFGYTSEMHNPDDSIYLRARHYNPNMGMFLQRDTYAGDIMRPASLQRFAYVEGNPMSYTDPTGNIPKWFTDAVTDAVKDTLQGIFDRKPSEPGEPPSSPTPSPTPSQSPSSGAGFYGSEVKIQTSHPCMQVTEIQTIENTNASGNADAAVIKGIGLGGNASRTTTENRREITVNEQCMKDYLENKRQERNDKNQIPTENSQKNKPDGFQTCEEEYPCFESNEREIRITREGNNICNSFILYDELIKDCRPEGPRGPLGLDGAPGSFGPILLPSFFGPNLNACVDNRSGGGS